MTPENRNTIDDATHDEWLATSRNMKMEISREWAAKSARIEGDAAVGAGLPSALGLPKLAAPISAFPRATGSNPVPVGVLDMLEWKWRSIAAQHRSDAEKTISAIHRPRLNTAAEALEACALELRLLTGATTERQPDSNK